MRKRRKTTKVDGRSLRSKSSFTTLKCSGKGCTREVQVDKDVVSVICWECVQKKVGIDPKYLRSTKTKVARKTPEGFPRGFHLYKTFVHADGRVFEKGVENVSLKGTLPPTEVKVNTLTRTQRRRLREEKKLKREARLAKRYEKKMKMKEKQNV
jgi:hypothetical protein